MFKEYYATGKRKVSVAKVWLSVGSGKVVINHKDLGLYFRREALRMIVLEPLFILGIYTRYNIKISVFIWGAAPGAQRE